MAVKTKAPADYDRLFDHQEIVRDGYSVRVERAMGQIQKLLADHKDRAKVEQLIAHYAVQRCLLLEADQKLARYDDLRKNLK